jgi:hypothetical protein
MRVIKSSTALPEEEGASMSFLLTYSGVTVAQLHGALEALQARGGDAAIAAVPGLRDTQHLVNERMAAGGGSHHVMAHYTGCTCRAGGAVEHVRGTGRGEPLPAALASLFEAAGAPILPAAISLTSLVPAQAVDDSNACMVAALSARDSRWVVARAVSDELHTRVGPAGDALRARFCSEGVLWLAMNVAPPTTQPVDSPCADLISEAVPLGPRLLAHFLAGEDRKAERTAARLVQALREECGLPEEASSGFTAWRACSTLCNPSGKVAADFFRRIGAALAAGTATPAERGMWMRWAEGLRGSGKGGPAEHARLVAVVADGSATEEEAAALAGWREGLSRSGRDAGPEFDHLSAAVAVGRAKPWERAKLEGWSAGLRERGERGWKGGGGVGGGRRQAEGRRARRAPRLSLRPSPHGLTLAIPPPPFLPPFPSPAGLASRADWFFYGQVSACGDGHALLPDEGFLGQVFHTAAAGAGASAVSFDFWCPLCPQGMKQVPLSSWEHAAGLRFVSAADARVAAYDAASEAREVAAAAGGGAPEEVEKVKGALSKALAAACDALAATVRTREWAESSGLWGGQAAAAVAGAAETAQHAFGARKMVEVGTADGLARVRAALAGLVKAAGAPRRVAAVGGRG